MRSGRAPGLSRRRRSLLAEIPPVRRLDTLDERRGRLPSELRETAHVEELPGAAVRLARVEHDLSLGVDDPADRFRQLPNRQIFAGADVDVAVLIVVLHQ